MSDQLRTIFGSGRRHLVTITFVALLVVLTAYYFLRAGAISSKQALIDEKSKSIRKLTTTVKNAVDIEKHTERLKIINNAIDTAALKDGELAANQQLFLKLESETGVKILDIRPQGVVSAAPGSNYVFMNFSLSLSGEFSQIIKFIKKIERGPTLSRIANASIGSEAEGEQSVALTVELLGVKK